MTLTSRFQFDLQATALFTQFHCATWACTELGRYAAEADLEEMIRGDLPALDHEQRVGLHAVISRVSLTLQRVPEDAPQSGVASLDMAMRVRAETIAFERRQLSGSR
jgi:hypothetical protein